MVCAGVVAVSEARAWLDEAAMKQQPCAGSITCAQAVPRLSLAGRRGAKLPSLVSESVQAFHPRRDEDSAKSGTTGMFGFEIGEVLGTGSMAVVRRAVRTSDRKEVAVKCVSSQDEEHRRFTREEYDLMRKLSHPAIACAYSFHERLFDVCICMEYCADGCVQSYVEQHGAFDVDSGQRLLWQFLTGVDYLHCKRVVHRDLKPANLVLHSGASVVKITDFNSAKQIGATVPKLTELTMQIADVHDGGSVMLTDRGSQHFKAPEIRFGHVWNERVDIWSYGLCAHFMLAATLPFDSENRVVSECWVAGRNPDIQFDNISEVMKNLILQCLTVNMRNRPVAMELLLHPAFATKHQGRMRDDKSLPANNVHPGASEMLLLSCGLLALWCGPLQNEEPSSPHTSKALDVQSALDLSPAMAGWQERRYNRDALRRLMVNRCERTVKVSEVSEEDLSWIITSKPCLKRACTTHSATPFNVET